MLVMTKKKMSDSVDYPNSGPKMNFLNVFTHTRDRCCLTSEYVTD